MSGETGRGDEMAAGTAEDAAVSVDTDTRITPGAGRLLRTIVGRELRTVVRTRTFLLLGFALTAVLLGAAWVGGGLGAGYVATTVDLLTPLELLVPIVAVAFGYRAVLADERRENWTSSRPTRYRPGRSSWASISDGPLASSPPFSCHSGSSASRSD